MSAFAARVARAIHSAALWLLPGDFRSAFGAEMEDTFATMVDETARSRGTVGVVLLLVRSLADCIRHAVWRRSALRTTEGGGTSAASLGDMVAATLRDSALGLRMFARRPVFTAVAVITLALGIGANTAIFSVVNAVLLRPLPFPEAEELVRLYHANPETGNREGPLSLPDREDWAEAATALEHVAVYTTLPSGPLFTGGEDAAELRTAYVSSGFFDVLGREPHLGRVLRDEEEYGDNRVVVLSHGFWQRQFGGDERIVGRTVTLDDEAYLVTGVMPEDFRFPSADVEAWVFLTIIPEQSIPIQYRQVRFLEAVGRLAEDVSIAQARSELGSTSRALVERFPEDNEGLTEATVVPLQDSMTASVSTSLLVLLGAAGLVLLIACGNVANLLLSRGMERTRELDIRRALGAGRRRLVRQLLTESLMLSALGTVAGLGLAHWGTTWLLESSGGLLPRSGEIGIDARVLLFATLVAVLTAGVFGLAPALSMTGGRAAGVSGARAGHRRPGATRRWGLLTGSQVALATVLVITAGLLLRGLWSLQRVDVGVDAEHLLTVSLTINDARYPETEDYTGAYERLLEAFAALPGVERVASIRYLPLRRDGESFAFGIPDRPEPTQAERPRATILQVSPGFFATAGVPLLSGREFTIADREDAPPVVVINDALRRRYFPGQDPVGQHILGAGGAPVEIIGLVGDVRQTSLSEETQPTLYAAQAQNSRRGMAFVIRTAGDPAALLPMAQGAIRELDPDQPIEHIGTMTSVVEDSTARPRFFSSLLLGFAALAMLLAAFGIYGVVSNAVSRRVSEIGVRIALGATRREVLAMVLRDGMLPVAIGGLVGVGAALVTTRVLDSVLYGVSATDPATFATVPLLLMAVAFAACFVPAARAVRIDPTVALRTE